MIEKLKPYLTTLEAAIYCGFRTTGAIRKAVKDGRLVSAGRRGGNGMHVFLRAELDRFLTGTPGARTEPDRLRASSKEGAQGKSVGQRWETVGSSQPRFQAFTKRKEEDSS